MQCPANLHGKFGGETPQFGPVQEIGTSCPLTGAHKPPVFPEEERQPITRINCDWNTEDHFILAWRGFGSSPYEIVL